MRNKIKLTMNQNEPKLIYFMSFDQIVMYFFAESRSHRMP